MGSSPPLYGIGFYF